MATPIRLEDAAGALAATPRVLVIGCSGSGKSTLARALAARLGLRHISMDRDVFWLPGWKERPHNEAYARIAAFIEEERWVMDGTSPGSLPLRLPRTGLVIWLRLPRLVALRGALLRWMHYAGRTRSDMAPGCPEKIDFEFLHYIWTFERLASPKIDRMLNEHGSGVPLLTLRSHAEMDAFLSSLPPASGSGAPNPLAP